MARPHKIGLDYFPHDTHPDKKLERFFLLYEAKGKSFWYTMLEEIYAEGWSLSIADSETVQILAKKAYVTVPEWNTMLATAIKLDLFDLQFYEQQAVLTSNGIKRRWEIVAKKRMENADYYVRKQAEKSVSKKPKKKFHPPETPPETSLSGEFHLRAKEKESKEKERREEKISPVGERARDLVWDCVVELFGFKAPHPKSEATRIGKVSAFLKTKGATPEEMRRRFQNAKSSWSAGTPFGPEALTKWWDQLENVEAIDGKTGSGGGHPRAYESAAQRNARKLFANLGLDQPAGDSPEAVDIVLPLLPQGTAGGANAGR